jgi:glucokinase
LHTLGVDIGGTKIAVGIVDDAGRVVAQERCNTPAIEGGNSILNSAVALSETLITASMLPISRIGIGAGGQINATTGVVLSATDLLPGWAGQNIVDCFQAAFNLPTCVENDVNALALGEFRFGSALGLSTVVFLAIGTGVGGAILIDGKIHHGTHWSGGELGHLLIDIGDNARIDSGGHRGTLEAYASGHGLVETWRQITGDRAAITGEEIAQAAEEDTGGPAVLAVSQTGRYLGFGLVTIANILDPDLIVIGGGMAALGDMLLDPARVVLKERALPGPAACPIVTASLGAAASIIGAASVAMEAMS